LLLSDKIPRFKQLNFLHGQFYKYLHYVELVMLFAILCVTHDVKCLPEHLSHFLSAISERPLFQDQHLSIMNPLALIFHLPFL
jgi:hypothetical protein